jgi:S-(hydroxymethyl)glutathione dehydrogenase/alcohol dehydrogenase
MHNLKMKAAILEKLNAPLVVDHLDVPGLEVGQVLVKVCRSGICGKQIGEIAGLYGEDKYLPHLLGHEGGGIVVKTGPGVTKISKGDHVVMHWRKGAGIESAPPKYRRDSGTVGGGLVTTFNEFAVVSENRLTPIPEDIPLEVAALMGCAVTTALGLINNEAQLKIGQSIAISGCGGVGLNVVQGASLVSAAPIIAIDKYDNKLQMAASYGATHIINSAKSDVREEIYKIVGRLGVDVFVECTGIVSIIEQAYELTAPSGRTILVGQPRYDQNLTINSMMKHFGGKKIFASQGGLTNPTEDIPRYLRLYTQGKLNLSSLITHTFQLNDINLALDKMRAGKSVRCMITME